MYSKQDFSEFEAFFNERKCKLYICDCCEILNPLNNRINFIIVNCLQHALFNLMHFMSNTTFTMSMLCTHKSSFLEHKMGIVQKLFILKFEPDLDLDSESFVNMGPEETWKCSKIEVTKK